MKEVEVDYFPVWRRYPDLIRRGKLTKLQIADLFIAMMDYQFEGIEPEELDDGLWVLWAVIQQDLDFARKRYETSVLNGKKGGRKKKQQPEETQNNLQEGKTITESISDSKPITKSISISNTDTEQMVSAKADLSVCKRTYGEFGWIRLSDSEYCDLVQEMGADELIRCINYIDESAQSTGNRNNWLNWHMVLRRCYRNRWHETSRSHNRTDIPNGARGELGAAELEAIAQVLAT